MNRLTMLACSLVGMGLGLGCQTKAPEQAPPPEPTPAVTSSGGEVSYDGFVKGWLQSQCVSCHYAGGNAPNLTSFDLVKTNASKILASIQSEDNPMPPAGPRPGKDVIDKLRAWIKAGRPKSTTGSSQVKAPADSRSGTAVKPAALVTYNSFVRGWLEQQCTVCHRAGATPPDLTTYQGASAFAARSLSMIRGNDPAGIMPPNGRPAAPDIISKMESWIKAGTPER